MYVICQNHPYLQKGYTQLYIIKIGIDTNSLSAGLLGTLMIHSIRKIYWKTCSNQNRLSKATIGL